MSMTRTFLTHKLHVGIAIAIGWMVVGGCSRSANSPFASAVASSQTSSPTGRADSIAQLLDKIEITQRSLPKDRLDASAALGATKDAREILAWVADKTRFVPYEGSLKGARGVLMDRSGNSLDRALLVRELLTLAGYQARIVSSASSVSINDTRSSGVTRTVRQGDRRNDASEIASEIMAKVGALNAATTAVESRHYWSQYRANNQWVDADPSPLPPGGHSNTVRTLTLAEDSNALPRSGNQLHCVSLRVVAERWDAGNLVEEPLLTLSFDGSSSPLASQTLTFLPVDRPGQRVLTRDIANGAALRAQLLSENAWVILVTNNDTSESQLGRMFDEAGIVGDPPSGQSGPLSGSPRAAAQALADAFGGEPEQTTFLTAVRADYEIRIPGKPPHAVSRYLFDSLGAQARTGGQHSTALTF
jgi:hypothetical protein